MTALETSDFDRTVSMTLHRDLQTGVWYVDQIETRYGPVRNHTRFANAMPIDAAFSEDFLPQLKELLPTSLSQQIITVAGPSITTSSFATADLRLMTQAAKNGVQRVLIRFKRVVGRIMDMLALDFRPDTWPEGLQLAGVDSHQAFEMLETESKLPEKFQNRHRDIL